MEQLIHEALVVSLWDGENTYSSSSSSDSEEECSCERDPPQRIVKIQFFVETTVPGYSAITFQSHFRISRQLTYRLIERFAQSETRTKQPNGNEPITSEKAFLLTLWYIANTETFRQISDRFNVSLSSAYRCLNRVINFILTLCEEVIKWPDHNEMHRISVEFQKKQGIRNVTGAIDGCHVKIHKPKNDQQSYYNRKGFHSLLIQGIVDYRKLFLDVYCGEPGSIHDARLLRKSDIFIRAQDPNFFNNKFLLGDSAYPSKNWLVTPFKDNGALTRLQKLFNYKHSSTRIVVENAYGLLKGRFRRLLHLDNLSINFCVKCIMACCILHNICIIEKDNTVIVIPNIADDLQSDGVPPDYHNMRREQVFNELFRNLRLH